ncbi:MAG: ABC-2 family transporter protein [Desulfobacterales bacterium]|nr:MAG: ABC-2 family transporter protein [Desulfobacterales bacterium]
MLLKFWYIVKLVWIERMAYRMNFLLEVVSGIVSSLIVVFLWLAIYRSAGRELIGGYTVAEMVTYLLGGGLINTFILSTAENPETSQSIQDGTLSGLLIQPLSPYAVWFARDFGNKAFFLVLGLASYVIVVFFFRDYLVLSSGSRYRLVFLISILAAAVLQFLLFEALSLLSFWVENTYGIRFTLRVIMEVVGGAIIPLSFFPSSLQTVFSFLPFPYVVYLPMRIFLGKIGPDQIVAEFVKEAGWIAALALLNLYIWKKGIRQYLAMGD